MKRRAKREDDYLGPSRGWAKVMHRTVMFILLPLRKPWWSLLFAVILFLAPTFAGVKPAEVHLWYWKHIKNLTTRTTSQIVDKAQKVMPTMEDVNKVVETVTHNQLTKPEKGEAPKIINQPLRQTRRKTFEVAKSAPRPMEVAKEAKLPEPQAVVPTSPATEAENAATTAASSPQLRYLSKAQFIRGFAEILNANELRIVGKSMFLHGIYVAPNSAKGLEGKEFLQSATKGKDVDCHVVAYTFQNIPTAICYINGVNLNREMVKRGYSKNVALD